MAQPYEFGIEWELRGSRQPSYDVMQVAIGAARRVLEDAGYEIARTGFGSKHIPAWEAIPVQGNISRAAHQEKFFRVDFSWVDRGHCFVHALNIRSHPSTNLSWLETEQVRFLQLLHGCANVASGNASPMHQKGFIGVYVDPVSPVKHREGLCLCNLPLDRTRYF